MPTVKLNKKVFEKLVGKKLPIEKLKDRISMMGTDLDSIEGDEISVEIFPNRPDMLSEQGFARAFSSFIGVKTGLKEYKVNKTNDKLIVKNLPKEWPYAIGCVVRGLKLDDEKVREIIQIQEKLGTTLTRNRAKGGIGLYPVNKVKFPITFSGKNPKEIKFRPLEFPKEITALQMLSQHPKGREYGHLMENWKTFPVFTDANGTFMSMPPVINSHDVGKIDETTTDVFIEATGPDLKIIKQAINIIATALSDMGGKIYSLKVEIPKEKLKFDCPDLKPKSWNMDIDYINKRLGLNLKEKEVKTLLEKMGYGYAKGKVLVPAYRADIMHQVDFAEDIAIAYGYENFDAEIPNVATIGKENPFEIFKRKVAEILAGNQLLECDTYNLTNEDLQTKKMNTKMHTIKLANAFSQEYSTLRAWIIPSLLQILSENKQYDYPQNIFTIGRIFKKGKTESGVEENDRVAVLVCDATANFTKIKQSFDYLMRMLNIKYETKEAEHPSFIPGRTARITVKGKDVAYIGEIHPQVLENFSLEFPVAAFELNLSELF
ncbi:phenylalanine--tRNA ligase subunit beta [archaeon]|jgi:phenylalanyl-tRNA synthetase beta chain|nr:phenylalanine--tRNA ligase subunit beta [archaeon]MBT4396670.1 phenylalanine--tRNA ligase subunit beta [archaeon]MBT4441280.1 phenylalanine--tRNA ligase subunit beta [archaeon]